jgi:hypothetical protein
VVPPALLVAEEVVALLVSFCSAGFWSPDLIMKMMVMLAKMTRLSDTSVTRKKLVVRLLGPLGAPAS